MSLRDTLRIIPGLQADADPEALPAEDLASTGIRPMAWDDIIGQTHIKDALKIYIGSAQARKRPLDHVLLKGPAGLGKTAFAGAISGEFGAAPVIHLTGPQLNRDSVAGLVSDIAEKSHISPSGFCIVFIDEIHGIDRHTATIMLPLLEYWRYGDQIIPPFCCIGATTDPAKLLPPFRRRFQIQFDLDYYTQEEIEIILRKRLQYDLGLNDAGLDALVQWKASTTTPTHPLEEVASICRGTPWRAVVFSQRLKDFIVTRGPIGSSADDDVTYEPITSDLIGRMRKALDIDSYGLERKDRKILTEMLVRFKMRAVGVRSIAAAIGEDQRTLEEIIEPDLVRLGYINREPRGRVLTELGIKAATEALARRAAGGSI